MLAKVKALWLGEDRDGIAAVFECGARSTLRRGRAVDPFELAARLLAASEIAPGTEHDDPERVIVVLDPAAGAGYRSRGEIVALEDEMPDAEWSIARDGSPRVVFSGQPLEREMRESIAARADCVAIVGAREALERAQSAPVFRYVEEETVYVRSRAVDQPLRANELGLEATKIAQSFPASRIVKLARPDAEPGVKITQHEDVDNTESVLAAGAVVALVIGLPLAALLVGMLAFPLFKEETILWLPTLVGVAVFAVIAVLAARAWLRQPVRVRIAQRKRIATPAPREREEEEAIEDEAATEEGSRR